MVIARSDGQNCFSVINQPCPDIFVMFLKKVNYHAIQLLQILQQLLQMAYNIVLITTTLMLLSLVVGIAIGSPLKQLSTNFRLILNKVLVINKISKATMAPESQ